MQGSFILLLFSKYQANLCKIFIDNHHKYTTHNIHSNGPVSPWKYCIDLFVQHLQTPKKKGDVQYFRRAAKQKMNVALKHMIEKID